jgi:hypothetical protein
MTGVICHISLSLNILRRTGEILLRVQSWGSAGSLASSNRINSARPKTEVRVWFGGVRPDIFFQREPPLLPIFHFTWISSELPANTLDPPASEALGFWTV